MRKRIFLVHRRRDWCYQKIVNGKKISQRNGKETAFLNNANFIGLDRNSGSLLDGRHIDDAENNKAKGDITSGKGNLRQNKRQRMVNVRSIEIYNSSKENNRDIICSLKNVTR